MLTVPVEHVYDMKNIEVQLDMQKLSTVKLVFECQSETISS